MASQTDIQVSGAGGITGVVSRAATALEKSGEVVLTGINSGIPNVVQAVELLKHRIKGLHQLNQFERIPETTKTRVSIKLSLHVLDQTNKGYQGPIPEAEVQVTSLEELKSRPVREPREPREPRAPRVPGEGVEESKTGPRGVTDSGEAQRGGFRSRGGRRGRSFRGGRGPRGRGRGGRDFRPTRQGDDRRVDDNKYRKVRPPPSGEAPHIVPGELLISPRRPTRFYVKDAVLWFKREAKDVILLKASGWALSHAIAVAEEIKRAVKGLHQVVTFSKRTVQDVYEATEKGLDNITKDRSIPALEIRLSVIQPDTRDPGYQAPLPESLIKEISVAEAEQIA